MSLGIGRRREEEKKKRPCCDYCMLNKISVTDRYVLPMPEDIFDNIKDAGVYTTLDLRWRFHQVRVAEEDVSKTAFWDPDGSMSGS
jgi:hypothetical protein